MCVYAVELHGSNSYAERYTGHRRGSYPQHGSDGDAYAYQCLAMALHAMLCYAVSILLWIAVLSKGEVSYACPFLSVGYIVAAIGGYCFFGEETSLTRMLGNGVFCLGSFLISRS